MYTEPLSLELIEEGRLIREADEALTQLQRGLTAHVDKYGERAKGAKARVTITIDLTAKDVDGGLYAISSAIKVALPARPTVVTAAVSDATERGATLFCRPSGTTQDHPAQARLATDEGEVVDQATGEVKDRPARRESRSERGRKDFE